MRGWATEPAGVSRLGIALIPGASSADTPYMLTFWHWCVRAPFAALAVLLVAAGFIGIFEWALAMPAVTVCLIVAAAAHHLGIYAEIRRLRKYRDAGLLLPPSVRAFARERDERAA